MVLKQACFDFHNKALWIVLVVSLFQGAFSTPIAPLYKRSEEFRVPGQYIVVLKVSTQWKEYSEIQRVITFSGTPNPSWVSSSDYHIYKLS